MGMTIMLAIDTAAPRLQLALAFSDGGTDALCEDIAQGHAELIFDRIAVLLARNGLGYGDLTGVASTTGPGSFTGLRIALSVAQGIGLARGIPVLGIPSLLALSLSAPPGRPVAVLLDARRGEAYFQAFDRPAVPRGPAALLTMDEARARVGVTDTLIQSPFVDIAALARFAASADPAAFPPVAAYVRAADAKPQDAARIARRGTAG